MNDMDAMYQQIILDAAHEKHGYGQVEKAQGESFQVNPTCGDQVTLQINLSDDGSHIKDIVWQGDGCSISQASLSIMSEMLEGQSVDEAMQLYDVFRHMMDSRGESDEDFEESLDDAAAFVGVAKFPMRVKCALLGWMAMRDAADQALAAHSH